MAASQSTMSSLKVLITSSTSSCNLELITCSKNFMLFVASCRKLFQNHFKIYFSVTPFGLKSGATVCFVLFWPDLGPNCLQRLSTDVTGRSLQSHQCQFHFTSIIIGPRRKKNLSSGFSTRSYTHQPTQLQRLTRKLKFRF